MTSSGCDLTRYFGELASHVPEGFPGEGEFVFHAGVFPELPSVLSTDRMVVRKTTHGYNSWWMADSLWTYLSHSKARELGIFLLACVFQGPPTEVALNLTHPESDIRGIVMRSRRLSLEGAPPGLSQVPFAFRYSPAEVERFPWVRTLYSAGDLPLLALSNADDLVATAEHWRSRDTVFVESTVHGTVLLAELLLNAGCRWNRTGEYDLEGEAGCRGVAPTSAELKLILPGSTAWIFEGDDVPAVATSGS